MELHPPVPVGELLRRDGRPVTQHVTDRALTPPGVLAQEQRLVEWARTRLEPASEIEPEDQQEAVADAVAGTGRLVLVGGPAAAGKTTAIRAGVDALRVQASGPEIWSTAPPKIRQWRGRPRPAHR